MVFDAALRRSVERSRERDAIRGVLSQSRSWNSYLEIEARRVKEDYFSRLAAGEAPVVQKTALVCYDGVQRLALRMDAGGGRLVNGPLPELEGRSFSGAVSAALANAARLTAEHPPRLVLLHWRRVAHAFFP